MAHRLLAVHGRGVVLVSDGIKPVWEYESRFDLARIGTGRMWVSRNTNHDAI